MTVRLDGEEKPALEDLAHVGVLGMKWGHHRAKATGDQIVRARSRLEIKKNRLYDNHYEGAVRTKEGSAARAKVDAKFKSDAKKINTSRDRVIAARMTRGEKAVAIVFTGPFALIPIAATSFRSRRIEKQLDDGKFNTRKKK